MSWKILAAAAVALCGCTPPEHCPLSSSQEEWSAGCFEQAGATRRVKKEYRNNIDTGGAEATVITIAEPRELAAVDRSGRVTIPHIYHSGDFDYPTAHGGIGRFAVKDAGTSRCGYFDSERLKIVIPAAYDQCHAFDGEEAIVCKQCASYCTQPECQDRVFIGGQGFALSRDNKIVRTFTPATLGAYCGPGARPRVKPLSPGVNFLECVPTTPPATHANFARRARVQ